VNKAQKVWPQQKDETPENRRGLVYVGTEVIESARPKEEHSKRQWQTTT